jgi:hypothetical protein
VNGRAELHAQWRCVGGAAPPIRCHDRAVGVDDQKLSLAELVESGDLDALTDRIDALCFDESWNDLVDLRDRCRAALDRGKQLWPAAAFAEYRIALDGPASIAALVVESPAERFSLGPFAEVMASTHTFAELDPFLPASPGRGAVAHERVVRGEDLRGVESLRADDPFGLPLHLLAFEPRYSEARYEPTKLLAPSPAPDVRLARQPITTGEPGARLHDSPESIRALKDLAAAWTTGSNGVVDAVMVEGNAKRAIATLGCPRHRSIKITTAAALDWMAWTSASGGAQSRRRGMAAGRLSALWAALCLAGLDDDHLAIHEHPLDELADVLSELQFFLFDDGAPATGWSLRLAVEDPYDGVAFAVIAADARLE